MSTRTIWAFQRLPELDHKVGFVNAELSLADALVKAGEGAGVQHATGRANKPRSILSGLPHANRTETGGKYQNKELTSDRGELLSRDKNIDGDSD